jgi:hypothetical protein
VEVKKLINTITTLRLNGFSLSNDLEEAVPFGKTAGSLLLVLNYLVNDILISLKLPYLGILPDVLLHVPVKLVDLVVFHPELVS